MLTQSVVLERVQALAEAVRHQVSLRQIVLFGSYARGEQRQWSDINVAIVADEFTGFGFQDVGLIGQVLSQAQFVDIEPHTFSSEQFTDLDPFVQEIKRTGIVVGEWESVAANQMLQR